MQTTIELIKAALNTTFQPTKLDVSDDKADHIGHANQDSGHFTVMISSPVFAGKSTIQQHRLIYDALGSLMKTHIHALRIKVSLV